MNKALLIVLAIFLPPVAVFMKRGAGVDLIINIVLWIVGFGILGIIHGLYIVLK